MSKLPGYDETVICPYNKCHVILKSRIQTHLVKCAKQHPEIQLDTCPFDITHKFRPEDKIVRFLWNIRLHFYILCVCSFPLAIQTHIETCPSRDNFDRYVYSIGTNNASQSSGSQPKAPTYKQPKYEDDEDWE